MERRRRYVILDSSVWISFLYKEDSQHERARKVLGGLVNTILVPEYVLIEVATALKRKGKGTDARSFVRQVLEDNETFLPSNTLVHETADLFCTRNDHLSFTDTALLFLSREHRVITFDKALARTISSAHE